MLNVDCTGIIIFSDRFRIGDNRPKPQFIPLSVEDVPFKWTDDEIESARKYTLLDETIDALESNGLTHKDVKWVGNNEIKFSWKYFSKLAFELDASHADRMMPKDMKIVGDGWFMERREEYVWAYGDTLDYTYHYWHLIHIPKEPSIVLEVDSIIGYDKTLEEINPEQFKELYANHPELKPEDKED